MNRETWKTLLRHGVTEATELRLEFTFDAPDVEAAETLVSFLRMVAAGHEYGYCRFDGWGTMLPAA